MSLTQIRQVEFCCRGCDWTQISGAASNLDVFKIENYNQN